MLPFVSRRIVVVHEDFFSLVTNPTQFRDSFDVHVTTSDTSILDQIDPSADLLILDWNLETPDARGVLDLFDQRAPKTRVLALTTDVPADDPIDRGADEYLVLPVSDTQLRSTIEQLLRQQAYEETMETYFRLATERAVLEDERRAGIDVDERYEEVRREIRTCRKQASALREQFSSDEIRRSLRHLLSE